MIERGSPRAAVRRRLQQDLDEVTDADVRSALFCGEMGCGERGQAYLHSHPELACPYMGRVDDPSDHCARLRLEYRRAMGE